MKNVNMVNAEEIKIWTEEIQRQYCEYYLEILPNKWYLKNNHLRSIYDHKVQLGNKKFYDKSMRNINNLVCVYWDEMSEKYRPYKRFEYDVWEKDFQWRFEKENIFEIMKKKISKRNALDVFWKIKKKYFMTDDGHKVQIALKVICEAYDISRSEVVGKSKVIRFANESGYYKMYDFVDTLASIKKTWQNDKEIERWLDIIHEKYPKSTNEKSSEHTSYNPKYFRKEGLETYCIHNKQWDRPRKMDEEPTRDIFEHLLFFYFWREETHFHHLRFTQNHDNGLMLMEWDYI